MAGDLHAFEQQARIAERNGYTLVFVVPDSVLADRLRVVLATANIPADVRTHR